MNHGTYGSATGVILCRICCHIVDVVIRRCVLGARWFWPVIFGFG
jgi:hypothetical protein